MYKLSLVALAGFLAGLSLGVVAQERPEESLSEVLQLRVENLQLKDAALAAHLETVLAQINYRERLQALTVERTSLEADLIADAGGDTDDTWDWEAMTVGEQKAVSNE